ncbi:hypothetical protein K431DRAFT_265670 [Polychaeton citri CBS 116435]|uniref:Thiolase-like protein type 1 additional C-terminal domain-containing protein n=1 Tax=Polychaeton citri CBS 116435 TaxID=1314669 RepID=A0A9P4URP8_9PEZI|nr:hypothetical protein K431DRAFT_265670 [Polychaeton citri CBS 116435]
MASNHHIPVIIGVGDVVNRSRAIADAVEPLQLMVEAISNAFSDTCTSEIPRLRNYVDSIDVVRNWTWPYTDIITLLSEATDIKPTRQHLSDHGGNQPAKLLDEAARRIANGDTKVAVLAGGEALASLLACAAARQLPPPGWTKINQNLEAAFSPTTRRLDESLGSRHGIGAPIHVYPLYENGFRAHNGQSITGNHDQSAELYGQFAKVASTNANAWAYGREPKSSSEIGTPSKENRMICFPYPLLMNAFNNVNLAAAIVLTNVELASGLGVPEEKWIYPLGGAGYSEGNNFWDRPNFHSSSAISRSIDGCLAASGLGRDEIDLFDLYSCFPIVPKLACQHLGLAIENPSKPITLLGGLTSFGGPGSSYSMHALTEMTRQLRMGKGNHGLVLANGGVLTYQHAVVLSRRPPVSGHRYLELPPLEAPFEEEESSPRVVEVAEGEAVIETYTVEFGKDEKPLKGHVVGRLVSDGSRFLANHADHRTLKTLSSWSIDPIGRRGIVAHSAESGRNLFALAGSAKI